MMTNLEVIGKQIDETRHLLLDNTNKLIERDSHLDDIERQTANLELNSYLFKKNSRKLKHKMICNNYLYIFFFIGGITALIFIILLINK